jgi:hypothetical protein
MLRIQRVHREFDGFDRKEVGFFTYGVGVNRGSCWFMIGAGHLKVQNPSTEEASNVLN